MSTTRASNLCCALLATAVLLAVVGGGCTSDDPNEVGTDLVTMSMDTVLAPLGLTTVNQFSALDVEDSEVDFDNQQVVYLGTQQGDSSHIVLNYDFGDSTLFAGYDDSLFTLDNIKTVNYSLQKLTFYGSARSQTIGDEIVDIPPPDIDYRIFQVEPVDSNATPPVPVPETGLPFIDNNTAEGNQPLLPMSESLFLDWYNAKEVVGVLVTAGPESDPGLVGYASRDLLAYYTLDAVAVGTVVAPNFQVSFEDESIVNFLMPPVADLSTFHRVTPPPTEPDTEMLMRGSLRSYPALLFDFAGLPSGAYINRATLRVTADTSRSFGPLTTLAVSEMDSIYFTESPTQMTVGDLGSRTYQVATINNADPYQVITYEFNVTDYVQRRVNEVYEGTRGLAIGVAERFNNPSQTPTPEFYFNEIRFMGLSVADSVRPQLRITYTTTGDVGEVAP